MKMLFIMPLTSLESPSERDILTWITELHQEWSEIQNKIGKCKSRNDGSEGALWNMCIGSFVFEVVDRTQFSG